MATLNIYLSDELKRRMEAHDLKWSQIAAGAIETAIKIEELKGVSMEQANLERLRASRAKTAEKEKSVGEEAGKSWALERAEYDELERLYELSQSQGWFDTSGKDNCALAVAVAIMGEERPDWRDINDLMETISGRKAPSEDFLVGFVEGAGEVFGEV